MCPSLSHGTSPDDFDVELGAGVAAILLVAIQSLEPLSAMSKTGSPSALKWCSPMMRLVLLVPWATRVAMNARDPIGVALIIAGTSWRRARDDDAMQEASKSVAAAPMALGLVVVLESEDASDGQV